MQVPTLPGAAGLHRRLSRFPTVTHCRPSPVLLDLFLRLSSLHAVTHPSADQARCCWTSSSAVPFSGGHPSHCRPSPVLLDLFLRLSPLQVVTHPSADLDRFSWTSSSAVPFFGGHPSHCRPSPVLLDAFLRLSPLQVVTHPSAYLDLDFSWTSSSAVPFSGSHPSHCRPSPVMLDIFLRLSPLQAFCCLLFTHPCPDLARLSWTCSSAIPFSWVTHPTADRAQCCLTLFFGCLLFRWSPILVPTWTGSPGLHLRLSCFPAVTHLTADMAGHLWTSFSAVPFFGGHPSHRRPCPVLLDIFLRLSPL